MITVHWTAVIMKVELNKKLMIFFVLVFLVVEISFTFLNIAMRLKPIHTTRESKYTSERKEFGKKHLILAVGILSKLSAVGRREAIRYTWLRICRQRRYNVVCKFFTDSLKGQTDNVKNKTKNEELLKKDLIFMPYKGGHNFALRLLWMITWFKKRFGIDYFLRIDDDYFLCLDRLLLELPSRPKTGLYWGYIHCREHVVRVDEGWMILSRDIIDEALNKMNTTLPCHPFGDQAVALWVQESKINITYFSDNERVIHAATAYQSENFLAPNICEKYIGLHGSYPTLMLKYWILSEEIRSKQRKLMKYKIPEIKPFAEVCRFKKEFDLRWFWPHVRFSPKPCKDNPTWGVTNQAFKGREYLGEEAIF